MNDTDRHHHDMTLRSRGLEFIPMEQAICLKCDSVIPQECITTRLLPQTSEVEIPRQQVQAMCEHCNTLYELTRRLADGRWQTEQGVQIVRDERKRRAFANRTDERRRIRRAS